MTVQDWLGKENQLGIDIWEKKYRNDKETFEQWLDRVSNGNKPLRQLIRDKKFLFGGRTLSNRGIAKSGTYFNCYSLGYIEDDYKQILQAAMDMGLTYKAQGGQGVSLTKIRPIGTPIGTRYKSDGIVPFMRLYNSVTTETSQGGARKGALMISLDIRHKEAETFITLKNQSGVVEKANLSLEIDDEFMKAVKTYYDTGKEIVLHETRDYGVHHIEYDIIPIKLYKLLVQNCYDWGDPACLFTNKFRNYNLMQFDDDYQVETSNPCFTSDMRLLTAEGYKTFGELDGKHVDIININGSISNSKVWKSGDKETVRVIFWDNSEIKCTPDHVFMTIDGDECKAKDLKGKKILPFINSNGKMDKQFIKYGFIQGDGQLSRTKSKYHKGIEVNIGSKDGDILDLFSDEVFSFKGYRHIYLSNYIENLKSYGFSDQTMLNRILPTTYNTWTKLQKASFLQGCFSANGSALKSEEKGSCRVCYKTICKEFANQLSKTLLDDFGIESNITTNKASKVTFSNGEYLCKESYDVNIGKFQDILKFYTEINFYQQYKRTRLKNSIIKKCPLVRKVDDNGIESVYDFCEPETHWGVVNGFIAHNCGEQPLPKNFCCNLGSLNLSAFVKKQFTDDAYFDTRDFLKSIEIAVEALDELIDENAENHPLESQKINSLNYRNIGLGITGYGTALMMLQIKYGSEEAKEFTDCFMRDMFEKAFSTSSYLAERKGSFPLYKDVIFDSEIVRNHSNGLINMFKPMGLRNCSLLSFAPAGTLSLLFGVTSGIEPEFSISYKRKTESLINNEPSYYDVYCNAYLDYKNITGKTDMPDYFVTAKDISWKDRIDTQSIMQYHLDTAISSTINLSQDTSIKDVEELYLYAWEKGLKGITIFRDGCKRLGILTTDDKVEKPKEPQKQEFERGFVLDISNDVVGKKRKLMTGCGSLHCVAFFDPQTGDLLETYLSKGSTGGCQNFMVGLSRMISLSARAGCDINSIVNQLDSCGVCPSYSVRSATKHDTSKGSCCPMAIGNALIEMHNEMLDEIGETEKDENYNLYDSLMAGLNEAIEIEAAGKDMCPDCNEPLIFEGGCNTCKNCGWSKCT